MTKQLKGSGTFAGKSRTKEHHTNPFKTVWISKSGISLSVDKYTYLSV